MTNYLTKRIYTTRKVPFLFPCMLDHFQCFPLFYAISISYMLIVTKELDSFSSWWFFQRWHLVRCCMSKQFLFILEIFYSLWFPCVVLIFQVTFSVACPSHVFLYPSLPLPSLFKLPVSFPLPL